MSRLVLAAGIYMIVVGAAGLGVWCYLMVRHFA